MFAFPFKDDPFFSDHGLPESFGRPAISARNNDVLQPFQHMEKSFDQMRRLMDDMTNGMRNEISLDGRDGHSYVQSSVYSYSKNANGEPEVYEAHRSNRLAPGGVREEKKALRDSRKKLEKLAVGRHLGDRGHVVERSRNMDTGHISQHQNLIGIEEADVDSYQREWQDRTRDWATSSDRFMQLGGGRADRGSNRADRGSSRAALEYNNKKKSSKRHH